MSDLSRKAQELIAAAAEAEAPLASDKIRVHAGLTARVAMLPPVAPLHPLPHVSPATSPTVVAPVHAALAPAAGGLTAAKLVVGSVLALTMGTATVYSVSHRPTTSHTARAETLPRETVAQSLTRTAPALAVPAEEPPPSNVSRTEIASKPMQPHRQQIAARRAKPSPIPEARDAQAPEMNDPGGAIPDASPRAAPSAEPIVASSANVEVAAPPAAPTTQEEAGAPAAAPPEQRTSWSVAREVAVLRESETALSNQPRRALELLDAYAREWPNASFAPERVVLRTLALCALGRVAEARESAAHFRSTWPGSPLEPRVQASCAGDVSR